MRRFKNDRIYKFVARNKKHRFKPNIFPVLMLFGHFKITCKFQIGGDYTPCCIPDQISKVFGVCNFLGIHKNSLRIGFRKKQMTSNEYELFIYSYENKTHYELKSFEFLRGDIITAIIETDYGGSITLEKNNIHQKGYFNLGVRFKKSMKVLLPDPYFGGEFPYQKTNSDRFYIVSKVKIEKQK